MPWTPDDAERHTHKATTPELKELWAKVANEQQPPNHRPLQRQFFSTKRLARVKSGISPLLKFAYAHLIDSDEFT